MPFSINHTLNIPYFKDGLQFDTSFENANLKKAIRLSSTEYKLLLEEDYNTKSHTHWFHFKTKAFLNKNSTITFYIINHSKSTSLYSKGLKPCTLNLNPQNKEWEFNTFDVKFYKTPQTEATQVISSDEKMNFYTLEFKYKFIEGNEEVCFAQAIPYSYIDLINDLRELMKNPLLKSYVQINSLCNSVGNNPCPVITITENVESFYDKEVVNGYLKKSKNLKKNLVLKIDKLKKILQKKFKNKKISQKKSDTECNDSQILEDLDQKTNLDSSHN